jgi:oligoendopeptidase F
MMEALLLLRRSFMPVSLPPYPASPNLTWADLEPIYCDLEQRQLDAATVDSFLHDWNVVYEVGREAELRLRIATTQNTADAAAAAKYRAFVTEVSPKVQEAEQRVQHLFLASGLVPTGFEEPLRKMRAETALFREENVPILVQEKQLQQEYSRITGMQTVEWERNAEPLPRLYAMYQNPEREVRERAWHLVTQRQMADRDAINDVWRRSLDVRLQLAANCDLPDYRAYRCQQLGRFDYTPDDASA